MYKKIRCVLLCMVFLLSISTVAADDNIETNSSAQIEDISFSQEHEDETAENEIETVEYYGEENSSGFEQLELNTRGVVMSDDDYSCGAASFATVMNNLGINMTLNEARIAVNTTVNGTTIEGIINGANKYNLTAYGISTNVTYLNENYIVHMSINGTDHWSVVKQISDDYIILADPNLGIVNYTKECFSELYTNNSIVISKCFIDIKKFENNNVVILNADKTKKNTGKKTKYRYVPKKARKQVRYNLNKGKWQYRWIYPTDVYRYTCHYFLKGYVVYYSWDWVDIKVKFGKWLYC